MLLEWLDVENVGPFDRARVEFGPGVTVVTGENGTGKSVLVDSIRLGFGEDYHNIDRSLLRTGCEYRLEIRFDGNAAGSAGRDWWHPTGLVAEWPELLIEYDRHPPDWVVDYWQSSLPRDSFRIDKFSAPEHRSYLLDALDGYGSNGLTTELICHFDYLRDSRDPQEKANGEALWAALERIVEVSLQRGRLLHVARSRLEPVFEQHGHQVGLDKLSAGSLYLIQRMVGLLGKMYSRHVLAGGEGDLLQTPGLLLIDEAENHLHPKWQKRFLPTIRQVFPNVQIVVATHSPFIVASAPDARIYVCEQAESGCVVREVTAEYAYRPVDEILASPVFSETRPFGQVITDLMDQRKAAIQAGDSATRDEIEARLRSLNKEYFAYTGIDELVALFASDGEG